MAATKNINTYVSVEEADAYFDDRLDVAAWTEAPPLEKEKSLVTATSILENIDWVGTVISDTQALAFPRHGTYVDPRLGKAVSMGTSIPDRIIKAQYELAYHLLNNDGLLDNTGSVKSLSLGAVELEGIRAPSQIPAHVKSLIRPLQYARGMNAWWRAN